VSIRYRLLDRGSVGFLVRAYEGRRLVGSIAVFGSAKGKWFDVAKIGVKPEYQRRGVGSALYDRAREEACRRGGLGIQSRDYARSPVAGEVWAQLEGASRSGEAYELPCAPLQPNESDSISESEAMGSKRYVVEWLRQVPEFMAELGIEDRPDLEETLEYLGSGGRADVIFLGERDGVKQVLKITNDGAQAALSQAALEDEPMGVVPVYAVVETEVSRRSALPELPRKGEEPTYEARTWGIIEKFTIPLEALYGFSDAAKVAGIPVREATQAYLRARDDFEAGVRRSADPLVEEWRLLYAAALEWIEETCESIGVQTLLDLHEGNWGIDPETGELVLIDLGQCYAP
jgi:hypothetical protein